MAADNKALIKDLEGEIRYLKSEVESLKTTLVTTQGTIEGYENVIAHLTAIIRRHKEADNG